jgi:curved DNA-binding protein CbpA
VARDAYRTLGVSPYADAGAISGAYRRLARELHPDVNHAPDADRRMKELNQAYEVLRDPGRRAAYDRDRLARVLTDHDWAPEPSYSYRANRWKDAYADARRAQERGEAAGRGATAGESWSDPWAGYDSRDSWESGSTGSQPRGAGQASGADGARPGTGSDPAASGKDDPRQNTGSDRDGANQGNGSGTGGARRDTGSGQAWQWYADRSSDSRWRWGFGSTGRATWDSNDAYQGEPQRWWPATRPYVYGSGRRGLYDPWRYVARVVGTVILILGLTAHLWAHAAPGSSRDRTSAPPAVYPAGVLADPPRSGTSPSSFGPAVDPARQGTMPNPESSLKANAPRSDGGLMQPGRVDRALNQQESRVQKSPI